MALLHGWRTCPRCAGDLANDGARAACASCGSIYYANSAPCVSALVEDGTGRLLLARRAVEPYLGLWDPPGGFLEEGEHPLDGLRRELLEETGLEGEPERFVGAWMDVYGDAPEAAATLNLYWTVRLGTASLWPPTTSPSSAGSGPTSCPAQTSSRSRRSWTRSRPGVTHAADDFRGGEAVAAPKATPLGVPRQAGIKQDSASAESCLASKRVARPEPGYARGRRRGS